MQRESDETKITMEPKLGPWCLLTFSIMSFLATKATLQPFMRRVLSPAWPQVGFPFWKQYSTKYAGFLHTDWIIGDARKWRQDSLLLGQEVVHAPQEWPSSLLCFAVYNILNFMALNNKALFLRKENELKRPRIHIYGKEQKIGFGGRGGGGGGGRAGRAKNEILRMNSKKQTDYRLC